MRWAGASPRSRAAGCRRDRRIGLSRAASRRTRRARRRRRQPLRRERKRPRVRAAASRRARRARAGRAPRGLSSVRAIRSGGAPSRRLRVAAASDENLMPFFVDAVDAGVTLGEICNVLREVFGTYRSKEIVRIGTPERMEIDHVAIVVKDLEATLRLYTHTLGFKEIYPRDRLRSRRRGRRPGGRRDRSSSCCCRSTKLGDRTLSRRCRHEAPPHGLSRRRHRRKTCRAQSSGRAINRRASTQGRARKPDRLSSSEGNGRRAHRTLPAFDLQEKACDRSAGAAARCFGRRLPRRPSILSS